MSITTDELRILLKVNGVATYTSTINQVTNVTNNYQKSCNNLISTLAKLASAGVIARFTKQCIQAASDLQEVANVVNVTFGKSADSVSKWAKTQAANFGLSETAAKRYLGTYGTMAKQFDFSEKEAAKMAEELTKLTGDVASFYNMDDKAAAVKLKSVFTGETESLKELGVVMTETQLKAYALSKGIDIPLKQMSEHEKVLLRYSFTMDKLSHAQGDFSRTSDGYANSVRGLSLNLENLKIEIGTQLLPVVSMGLQTINKGIQAISPVLIGIAETVKYYAMAWQQASATTKMFVKLSLGAFAIMIIAPKIIGVVSAAVKLLTMDIVTLGGALNAILGLAGIVLAALAIADLAKSVKEMKANKTSEEIDNLSDSVDTLGNTIEDLGDSTNKLDTFLASFDEVNKVGGGGTLASKIVNSDDLANILGFTSGLEDLTNNLSSFGEGTLFSADWWQQKKDFISGWWEYLKESFSNGQYWDDLKSAFVGFGTWLEELFPNWYGFWDKFGQKIYDVVEKLKALAQAWIDFYENAGENVFDFLHTDSGAPNSVGGLILDYATSRFAAGGLPNKGSLFLAGESGAELVGNFGGTQTKVINQSQITNNNSAPTVFSPTIAIDGRAITAVVLDNIEGMTRSSGNSPIIQLGG